MADLQPLRPHSVQPGGELGQLVDRAGEHHGLRSVGRRDSCWVVAAGEQPESGVLAGADREHVAAGRQLLHQPRAGGHEFDQDETGGRSCWSGRPRGVSSVDARVCAFGRQLTKGALGAGERSRRLLVVFPGVGTGRSRRTGRAVNLRAAAGAVAGRPAELEDRHGFSIEVDGASCIGSGMCTAIAPERFEFRDGGSVSIAADVEQVDDELLDAADSCPVQAIVVRDRTSGAVVGAAE